MPEASATDWGSCSIKRCWPELINAKMLRNMLVRQKTVHSQNEVATSGQEKTPMTAANARADLSPGTLH